MLKINNLSKTFNKNTNNEIIIFNDLKVEFETGKCTAIIGPNGCGKSTLLNIIAGTIRQDGGNILLEDEDISKTNEEDRSISISRVYQDPSFGVAPSLTILENLALADRKGQRFKLRNLVRSENKDKYIDVLSNLNLGLEDKLDTRVEFLSGGQRQSLSLVMATLIKPKLLLLDEHTAALDPKTSKIIMEKTRELITKEQITTIMISHNMKDAIKYSDNIIMLDRGEVVFNKKSNSITEADLLKIYEVE